MTQGTGQRSYRACLRCRQRKTRCNLDGVGDPKKPPCVACHHSGSECILVASRRGGPFRQQHQRGKRIPQPSASSTCEAANGEFDRTDLNTFRPGDDSDHQASDDDGVPMELRNPSDALQILARSGDANSTKPLNRHSSPFESQHNVSHNHNQEAGPDAARLSSGALGTRYASSEGRKSTNKVLEEYELIKAGSLHPRLLPELLQIYSQEYHSYCPIAPHYLVGHSGMDKIQKSDHFLLTVILTIASRDLPEHAVTHRRCWDYTQRLLSGVVLAHPWAQSPRTVQALLLLSEWLPHIQVKSTSSEGNKSLFAEDRTAWSLVGLAVRQGYLLRLDQAAFCEVENDDFKEREEQKRIIWTFVYLTDRQISARLGQAFWSRGPSVSSQSTASDFPSLRPTPGVTSEDLASVLQATIELIQILHHAHGILYSSAPRTLDMAHQGDYARYLDDFQRAASTWHARWNRIQVRKDIKSTLFIMYEYLCLYANAFAFQAILTRASTPRGRPGKERQTTSGTSHLFNRGIMSTWDGQYIFNAINAARNLLSLLNEPDTRRRLCFLPSRYLIYGVYAAVFLHKAICADVVQSSNERRSLTALALEFTSTLEQAPTVEPHVCHEYGRMLRNLWRRNGVETVDSCGDSLGSPKRTHQTSPMPEPVPVDFLASSANSGITMTGDDVRDQDIETGDSWDNLRNLEPQFDIGSSGLGSDVPALHLGEGLFSGSFFPGVTNFGQQDQIGGGMMGFGDPWIGGF